jgi:hypothetical protein
MAVGLRTQGFNHRSDLRCQLAGGGAAVETEVKRDLIIARPARVQGGTGRRYLRQPPLDRRVDVLIGVEKIEGAGIKLFAHPPQTSLDGGQLRGGDDSGGSQPSCVGDAAGDVKGVQLVIGVEGR